MPDRGSKLRVVRGGKPAVGTNTGKIFQKAVEKMSKRQGMRHRIKMLINIPILLHQFAPYSVVLDLFGEDYTKINDRLKIIRSQFEAIATGHVNFRRDESIRKIFKASEELVSILTELKKRLASSGEVLQRGKYSINPEKIGNIIEIVERFRDVLTDKSPRKVVSVESVYNVIHYATDPYDLLHRRDEKNATIQYENGTEQCQVSVCLLNSSKRIFDNLEVVSEKSDEVVLKVVNDKSHVIVLVYAAGEPQKAYITVLPRAKTNLE